MKLFGTYGPEDLSRFSVREIKFARARLGVLTVFAEMLEQVDYADIRIKDLSRHCEISEPSFYNYFPKKDDLFLYFISLWSVDIQLHTMDLTPGLPVIYEIFRYTASLASRNPNLLKEIIAYQARNDPANAARDVPPVTAAEKVIAMGSAKNMESYSDQGLGPVLRTNLAAALRLKQLPAGSSIDALTLALGALFFGVPVLVIHQSPERLADIYKKALDLVFTAKPAQRKVK